MTTRVRKWGNSLALRIPKAFVRELRLDEHSPVEMSLAEGRLVVSAAKRPKPTLRELLARVKKSNLHAETDAGRPQGREAW